MKIISLKTQRKISLTFLILLCGFNLNAQGIQGMYFEVGGLYSADHTKGNEILSNYSSTMYGAGVYFGIKNRWLYQMGAQYKYKISSFDVINGGESIHKETITHIYSVPITFGLNFLYFEHFSMGFSAGGSIDLLYHPIADDEYKVGNLELQSKICSPAFICGLEINAPYCWLTLRYRLKSSDYKYTITENNEKSRVDMPLFHGIELTLGVKFGN